MSELVDHVDEQDRVLGTVDRSTAVRDGRLHRVATVVCRDPAGRILVHRRPSHASRFPGRYNWLIGGAVGAGESYEAAAARELAEELGVRAPVRFVFKYLCQGEIGPYWLAVHEATVDGPVAPLPSEVSWHDWLTETGLTNAMRQYPFVTDSLEAYARYAALRREDGPGVN
ncbi:NUDIX domain-containing protein [Streptomyces antnestii]|uniref:NUDIX domain-containing protein n=1 Tax=Streptomyces antnestii TaxID=2494256 RepID=A0A3S2YZE7_9ACTN|nr:NUDIX domain-containing protein [Streptomyces sp. San01]RVU22891.1 NUDIX domain-containing protein [Streptomyces sp. San01]